MICDISSEAAGCGQPKLPLGLDCAAAPPDQKRDGLLLELQPILDGLSAKFANGNPHLREDLNQVGALAVFKAMQRFRPSKGSIACYAACCAKGAMLHHRRWLRKFSREISLSDFGIGIESEDDSPEGCNSIFRDDSAQENLIANVDGVFLRELAASVLTVRERSVLLIVFFDGNLPSEAALTLGLSAPRVSQLLQSALSKLRKHLTRAKCAVN
jgi:RNA polymerase sigma factor (sigma-70 family)